MKTMKNKGLTLFAACYLLFVFASCDNFPESPQHSPVSEGFGKIKISLVSPGPERTAFPSKEFDSYVYIFTKIGSPNTVETKEPDVQGYFSLTVGRYEVKVYAYKNLTLAANGTSMDWFDVGPGQNTTTILVPLFENDLLTDQGTFSYTISYPADASASVTLQTWPGMDTIGTVNPQPLSGGNGVGQTLNLDYGTYLLRVSVTSSTRSAGISEAIHIYPLLTTEYVKTFTADDLLAD